MTLAEVLIEDLIKAAELVAMEGGAPQDIFVPAYGWVLRDGEPTEVGLLWYKQEVETKK